MSTCSHPESDDAVFRTHFNSNPDLVASVVEGVVASIGDSLGFSGATQDLEIALTEVINNIGEHAYSDACNGPIELSVEALENAFQFQLVDRGRPMPGFKVPEGRQPETDTTVRDLPEGGFGWYLIRKLVHDLHYDRVGDENHLSFRMNIRDC